MGNTLAKMSIFSQYLLFVKEITREIIMDLKLKSSKMMLMSDNQGGKVKQLLQISLSFLEAAQDKV